MGKKEKMKQEIGQVVERKAHCIGCVPILQV